MLAIVNLIKYVVLLCVVPYLNFHFWREYGAQLTTEEQLRNCPTVRTEQPFVRPVSIRVEEAPKAKSKRPCPPPPPVQQEACSTTISSEDYGRVSKVSSMEFGKYKGEHLIQLKSPALTTTVIDQNSPRGQVYPNTKKAEREVARACRLVVNPTASVKKDCLAVVSAGVGNALNRLRIALLDEKTGSRVRHPTYNGSEVFQPTGFFGMGRMGADMGRVSMMAKLGPLLLHLDELEAMISQALQGRGIEQGGDVVLVVINDGEIDIFYNFACSLRAHGLEHILHKVVVFAGSAELVPLVEASGATGIHHESFFSVNRGASYQYLDKTFTDMMWYKSFSLWVMLKQGYNVLFQDADLVWFRDPFPYFHGVLKREQKLVTFFSDDGQRSMRYTPFYANSGFYYLPSDPHTIAFAYQIVISFDSICTMGSHQNVFTTKLMEAMDMGGVTSHMLDLALFPTGVQYHHNKKFMERFLANNYSEAPYGFHMCWTANKRDKIKYFKETGMWYTQDRCYISKMTPAAAKDSSSIYNLILEGHRKAKSAGGADQRRTGLDVCCMTQEKADKKFKVFKSKDAKSGL